VIPKAPHRQANQAGKKGSAPFSAARQTGLWLPDAHPFWRVSGARWQNGATLRRRVALI
jgi:hypothetical protein